MSVCRFCGETDTLVARGSVAQSPCSSKTAGARCAACAKLAQVDAKIAEARRALLDLHAQRVQILSDVNLEHDTFSKSLPVEIMSYIFRSCLPDIDSHFESIKIRPTDTPLRLSQVCQRWRTIAHSLPFLWNVIPLYVSTPDKFSFDAVSDVVREWVRCSGDSLPLKIVLRVARRNDSGEGNFHSVFTKIKEYIPTGPRRPYFMIELRQENAIVWTMHPMVVHMHYMLFKNIPHLEVYWLTHIEATSICVNDVFSILFSAHRLMSLQFSDLDHGRALDSNPLPPVPLDPPFVHRNLRHLGIINPQLQTGEEADTLIASAILDSFRFPAMNSFLLAESTSAGTMTTLLSLANQLRRTGARLQSLEVSGIDWDNPDDYTPTLLDVLEISKLHIQHLHFSKKHPESDDRHGCQLSFELRRITGQLPNLRTLRFQVGRLHWLCVLRHLLDNEHSAEVHLYTRRSVAIELWSFGTLMDTEAETFDPETLSVCENRQFPSVTATDIKIILMILDTLNGSTLAIQDRMQLGRYPLGGRLPKAGREILPEAVVALKNLLAQLSIGE